MTFRIESTTATLFCRVRSTEPKQMQSLSEVIYGPDSNHLTPYRRSRTEIPRNIPLDRVMLLRVAK